MKLNRNDQFADAVAGNAALSVLCLLKITADDALAAGDEDSLRGALEGVAKIADSALEQYRSGAVA